MSTKFRFSIDRGGTFTDIYAETPKGYRVLKLLSVDPANYADAPREGMRRILQEVTGKNIPKDKVDSSDVEWIRMGTTVATNALLERKGERTGFVTSKGFRDLLEIGNQARPKIFDLAIKKPELLYEEVIEIDERVRVLSEYNTPGFDPTSPPSPLIAHETTSEFVQGVTGEWVEILKKPNTEEIRGQLLQMYNKGIRSVAVSLLHSYTFHDHEKIIGKIAQEIGFTQISLSSATLPMIRIVPRAQTAMVDAYLTPLIKKYVEGFLLGFDENIHNVKIMFMMSDGGLCPVDHFNGFRAIVSGPAGGVVGYSMTTWDPKTQQPVIGFDMGGTSTDVSRFAGTYNHVFDTTIAGVTIQAPQLDINTVAAGGGSRLFFRSGLFVVGPESSGAHPGPVCYRKGGYLSITDANLFLGRLLPEHFPKIFGPNENEALDTDSTVKSFQEMTQNINEFYSSSQKKTAQLTADEVAYGFIQVANEAMCRPIRSLTEAKGYDASQHVLACFGGAGGQHACAIARSLGMRTVFIHRFAGILSAYGLGLADVVNEQQEPAALHYSPESLTKVNKRFAELCANATKDLKAQGFTEKDVEFEIYLNLRYDGTDTAIMTMKPGDEDYKKAFVAQYKREYGFVIEGRPIIIDDIRVRAKATASKIQINKISPQASEPKPITYSSTYFEGLGRHKTPVYILSDLGAGSTIQGPAIIIDASSTMLVENECEALITDNGDIKITIGSHAVKAVSTELDSIQLSVFSHRFMSIAEQMGKTLQRTSISTNIKERLDFSCALFGPDGGLVANAPHLPVHLGSMQEAVRWQIKHLGDNWKDGEVILANHPSAGGSHLPDMTVITPVFEDGKPVFYVASRGHHADIGGITPGSMPPFSRTLEEEGACIKSFKLVQDGIFQEKEVTDILMSPAKIKRDAHELPISGTRNLRDNLSDLKAQVAANQKGILLVKELISHYSLPVVQAYMYHVQNNAETAVRDMLVSISEHNKLQEIDSLYAEDFMDDGSKIALKLTINRKTRTAIFDFTGTEFEVRSNTNAPVSVTKSAVIYCLRCLVNRDIPLNQGCLNPIEIIIPEGSFLCPSDTAAVVGGNVLTSQRVTDVILSAFKASSNSQGCMNNFTFGDDTMGYYETIAGGAGAGPYYHGASAVQTHMTNTRITDAEILERRYPVLLREFSVRTGSGGKGKFNGGDGVVREMEFVKNKMTVGILSERRSFEPHGICGGGNGLRGKNLLIKKDGRKVSLGGKNSVQLAKGDRVRILTPGGGGYGPCEDVKNE